MFYINVGVQFSESKDESKVYYRLNILSWKIVNILPWKIEFEEESPGDQTISSIFVVWKSKSKSWDDPWARACTSFGFVIHSSWAVRRTHRPERDVCRPRHVAKLPAELQRQHALHLVHHQPDQHQGGAEGQQLGAREPPTVPVRLRQDIWGWEAFAKKKKTTECLWDNSWLY